MKRTFPHRLPKRCSVHSRYQHLCLTTVAHQVHGTGCELKQTFCTSSTAFFWTAKESIRCESPQSIADNEDFFLAAYPSPGFSSDKKSYAARSRLLASLYVWLGIMILFFSSEAITLRSGREIVVLGSIGCKVFRIISTINTKFDPSSTQKNYFGGIIDS